MIKPIKRIYMYIVFVLLLAVVFGACSNPTASEEPDGPLVTDPSPSPATFRDLTDINPDPDRSLSASEDDWYKDEVFYHVWINAFYREDGDINHGANQFGTIAGITAQLDYLKNLGVTGIWLSPFFDSNSEAINLHMYDTIDHYEVDSRVGTKADVDELLAEAHDRGMRVIFDWVPNHVSDRHRWFTDSAARRNDRDDWFVWRNNPGSQNGPWGQSVWHQRGDQWYYGVFWGGMPDINFRSQGGKDAITNAAIYWLNRGFDGLRVDAVKYLYEDEHPTSGGAADYEDLNETIAYFQAFREQVLDEFGNEGYPKFMVAENWTDSRNSLSRYMVSDGQPAFHMTLDFPFAYAAAGGNTGSLADHWDWVTGSLDSQAWMGTFTTNHDNVVNRKGDSPRARAAAAAMLTGPGTPFIYYGNEIGMEDGYQESWGNFHADRRHRQPFDWDSQIAQEEDDSSILEHHRGLTGQRHARPSLRRGSFARVDSGHADILAFQRSYEGEHTLVIINFSDNNRGVTIDLADAAATEEWAAHGLDGALSIAGETLSGSMPGGTAAIYDLSQSLPGMAPPPAYIYISQVQAINLPDSDEYALPGSAAFHGTARWNTGYLATEANGNSAAWDFEPALHITDLADAQFKVVQSGGWDSPIDNGLENLGEGGNAVVANISGIDNEGATYRIIWDGSQPAGSHLSAEEQ